jgi:hypothetical protein
MREALSSSPRLQTLVERIHPPHDIKFRLARPPIPIITGPPATAAMYVVARRIADGDGASLREAARALRQMLLPAWKWGALNLVIAAAVAVNFWAYNAAGGLVWDVLRLAWGLIATLWFAVTCSIGPSGWPKRISASASRSRNALVLYIKSPGLGLTLLIACALLIAAQYRPDSAAGGGADGLAGPHRRALAVESALKPAESGRRF